MKTRLAQVRLSLVKCGLSVCMVCLEKLNRRERVN